MVDDFVKENSKLNYSKFILILKVKRKQEIKTFNFTDSNLNNISFLSNSSSACSNKLRKWRTENYEDFVKKVTEKMKVY